MGENYARAIVSNNFISGARNPIFSPAIIIQATYVEIINLTIVDSFCSSYLFINGPQGTIHDVSFSGIISDGKTF
jgi:hypothetical protein